MVKADTEKFEKMFTDLRVFLKSFLVHVMKIILTIKDTANIAMSITFNSLESRIFSFELVLAVSPETSNNMIQQLRTCFSVVIRLMLMMKIKFNHVNNSLTYFVNVSNVNYS